MVRLTEYNNPLLQPKLNRLQDLQTEIYRQLQLLMPDEIAHYDSFQSQVHGSPLLRMDILERHPYTHFLRLTYQFEEEQQTEIAPDAHIRIYNDARLAEVTAFDHDQGFDRQTAQQVRDTNTPSGQVSPKNAQLLSFQRTWRKNRALDKWLSYLLHQGHGITSMRPAKEKISGNTAIPLKQTIVSL